MQNTSIRIIFVLYTYCILIFFYVTCVCTLFCDNVYKCSILNAAEKRLTLREHFTTTSDLNIRTLPATASVMWVRSVRRSSNAPLSKQQREVGGRQHLWGQAEALKVCSWLRINLTGRWRPAGSAQTLRTADVSFKTTFDTKSWWVKWLQAAACWLTLLIVQLALRAVFHPIRKAKVHVGRHLNTGLCSETVYTSQSLKKTNKTKC